MKGGLYSAMLHETASRSVQVWQVSYFVFSLVRAIIKVSVKANTVQLPELAGNLYQAQFEYCCGIFVK